ncbi:hypothetical protein Zmor_027681 [Zophobas morio]|uniref:Uncharacterized protein n=2 Tax=Zophobas morio TaxID=2755281 RepID=A0AA38HPR3_9CUCU|nr:hypothetical protein Zmor_027681 [Zophobas morio]
MGWVDGKVGSADPRYFLPIQAPTGRYTSNCYTNGYVNPPQFCALPPPVLEANPLAAALALSSSLRLNPKLPGYNHAEHLPLNPYVALLLSHYGKYAPVYGTGRGLYGYVAANNYHNNQPVGAYKIFEDHDG